jgi:hypothetical protein
VIIVTDDPGSKPDRDMHGRETGKITSGRIKYKFMTLSKKNSQWYNIGML